MTDNKPLMHILGSKKGIPQMAANRLQRIALVLTGYAFKIECIRSEANVADYFSRYPIEEVESLETQVGDASSPYINYVKEIRSLPITAEIVEKESKNDFLISKVMKFIQAGWEQDKVDIELRPYFLRRHELSVETGCLFWGYRIIIPVSLQPAVLAELHKTHMGIGKMKAMARSYCWWPKLDSELESIAKSCEQCLATRSDPPKGKLICWE